MDNVVILVVPGAMTAGLATGRFWWSLDGLAGDRVRGDRARSTAGLIGRGEDDAHHVAVVPARIHCEGWTPCTLR